MISGYFIDRPIFASVISAFIVIAGLAALRVLPVAQYPDILPPEVEVRAFYPGANAETVAQTVAAPLDQAINGVDGMLYLRSASASNGALNQTVTFAIGTDPDLAAINVNNRVQSALATLPEEVRRQGVQVTKRSTSFLKIIALDSEDPRFDAVFISNYALLNIVDELRRIPGVGDVQIFGSKDYSIRVWLRPDALAKLGLTPGDVAAAIREQNAQFAAGRVGEEPMKEAVDFTFTVTTQGRLTQPEEFGRIVIRSTPDGGITRLADVARIELGSRAYDFSSTRNGRPTVPIGVFLQPGANALQVGTALDARMAELAKRFPAGLDYSAPYDTTTYIRVSIREVLTTLVEAMLLVFAVVFLFLQNWRATLIPMVAVPVSLIGTLAAMLAFGFSINTLTLFGMVLAIGIVVDDAIVVLENVERLMATENLEPREATHKAMQPGDAPGDRDRLRADGGVPADRLPRRPGRRDVPAVRRDDRGVGGDLGLRRADADTGAVRLGAAARGRRQSRRARALQPLVRAHDGQVRERRRLPAAAHDARPRPGRDHAGGHVCAVSRGARGARAQGRPGLHHGHPDPAGRGVPAAHRGRQPEDHRRAAGESRRRPGDGLLGPGRADVHQPHQHRHRLGQPQGLGQAQDRRHVRRRRGRVRVRDRRADQGRVRTGVRATAHRGAQHDRRLRRLRAIAAGRQHEGTRGVVQSLATAASKRKELAGVQTTFSASVPQIHLELDREKAKLLGIRIADVYDTLQSTFGALYVNDFNREGRVFRVHLQSEAEFRARPGDIRNVYVRAGDGTMVPLTALVTVRESTGPEVIERYNVFPSAKILGDAAPGYSSGEALAAMEAVAREVLPDGYALEWTGTSYQEKVAGGSSTAVFLVGVLMVFLVLAAQYEKWTLPFAVILAVPFALFGAFLAVFLRGQQNDLYFQIGLVTLVGLASKNAILIVEFAQLKVQEGMSLADAAVEGARLRFRPIVMTSLAFILGVTPLAISGGAGAASRHSIATGVIGGMLAATFIATFFVPLFFRWIASRGVDKFHVPKEEGSDAA